MKSKNQKKKIEESLQEIMTDWVDKDYVDLVKVNWMDCCFIVDTVSLKQIREENLSNVVSIGYLLDENDECIKLCNFVFPDGEHDMQDPSGRTVFRNVYVIPKKMIKSILSLKVDFEESKKWRLKE